MKKSRRISWSLLVPLLVLAGCATRPVNPPIKEAGLNIGYTFQTRQKHFKTQDTLVVLAFSGGGTRAAAFSYGVLEFLRRTEVIAPNGDKVRILDAVDMITGVSGGSFTALAYGLYGDKLFDDYQQRFLKRNVEGELLARAVNPANWGDMSSTAWGRSELAANLYDEILFNGTTFADLQRIDGPIIAVSATDITSGARVVFTPQNFDVMCADLGAIRIARAAASSSAVPVVLSPMTFNNYGGRCGYHWPSWTKLFVDNPNPPRPAARVLKRLRELQELAEGDEPYIHLVDGGVSDNLGLRSVLDILELFEALREAGQPTPLDNVKRIVVFIVNSLSIPATDWARVEEAPGTIPVLIKSAGVPIDRYSGEQVEQLRDIEARWKVLRQVRDSSSFKKDSDPTMAFVRNAPDAELYAVDVSFAGLKDKAEREYLNQLPTSFVLTDEQVDRLRAAAGKIILDSPDFQRLLKDAGATIVEPPAAKPLN